MERVRVEAVASKTIPRYNAGISAKFWQKCQFLSLIPRFTFGRKLGRNEAKTWTRV